jgi:predicted ATPase
VQAVLAARIDRLPPVEKYLLQTAAVIGTEVPLPLLQAIAELPEADLHRGLAHLQGVGQGGDLLPASRGANSGALGVP